MCSVSMIGDHYSQKWTGPFQQGGSLPYNGMPLTLSPPVTREEFFQLQREVLEMKQLLLKAKEYDRKTAQPDCEQESKVEILKRVAQMVGVDLSEIFGPKTEGG